MEKPKKKISGSRPKTKLTFGPVTQTKASEHSLLLMQRLRELDREFARQTKELKSVTTELARKLTKRIPPKPKPKS